MATDHIEGQLILTRTADLQYELQVEGQPSLAEGQPLDLWIEYLQRFVSGRVKTKSGGTQVFSADPGQPTRRGYWCWLRPGMRVRLLPSTARQEQEEARLVTHLREHLSAYRGRNQTLSYVLYCLKAESVAWLRRHADSPDRLSQDQLTMLVVRALCEAGACIN